MLLYRGTVIVVQSDLQIECIIAPQNTAFRNFVHRLCMFFSTKFVLLDRYYLVYYNTCLVLPSYMLWCTSFDYIF